CIINKQLAEVFVFELLGSEVFHLKSEPGDIHPVCNGVFEFDGRLGHCATDHHGLVDTQPNDENDESSQRALPHDVLPHKLRQDHSEQTPRRSKESTTGCEERLTRLCNASWCSSDRREVRSRPGLQKQIDPDNAHREC